jgi:endoglucanase
MQAVASAAAGLLAAALLMLAGCRETKPPADNTLAAYPRSERAATPMPASDATRAAFAGLGPGVNFASLAAPSEGAWGSPVQDHYPATVWQAGFRHVRLAVRWSAHASGDAQAQIDAAFMARVDSVVTHLLDRGFTVVLNMHHYRQLDGDRLDHGEPSVDASVVKVRFLAMWQQIGTHFADRPGRLWFELYNEPHGDLTAAAWNDLASRALRVVRSANPDRTVVIGPAEWNRAEALDSLELPADTHLVATVHDYQPFRFTHQQARWAGLALMFTSGVLCCDTLQRQQLAEPLGIAEQWSKRHGVPMWLGEFGSYAGPRWRPNDMASRAEYTRLVREAAERRGIAWAYWEIDGNFGIYDPKARKWREPLLHALLPPS